MKPKLIFALLTALLLATACSAPQKHRGYPEKNPANLYGKFQKPPKGYGNVPFYWWNGDSLSRDRMSAQLEILSDAAIDGFAVSYCHTDPRIDTAMARNGYGFAGNTEPGAPAIFSEEWWETWKWYAGECAKYDIGVGLDDYTFGWPNNGYYPDQVKNLPEFASYQGTLDITVVNAPAGSLLETKVPENCISAVAWPGKSDLKGFIEEGLLKWNVPVGEDRKVYLVSTQTGYAIHPDHGKRLIDLYFGEFERRLTPKQFRSLNYFFQDELTHPISMLSWSEDFPEQFQRRKGYDILPYLPALKEYIGPETPKVRLDYCEVLMDLAEERYFTPIYDWHADKGLIYGSDNHGRGKDPLAYVDYFRANSWYTAPGNDAPANGSSFIETKVSSSISHLYGRPRTWLEAFHSMGWGSSGAWLTRQIDHHFIAGGNLVCMHGLYYSTHGGWWEWAPPDFHFRMPYWPHMKKWLEYTERMSYILSQGSHVCDIALMYPTESMQAYPDADASTAFGLAMELSNHGLDYDFMHYKHLREAAAKEGSLVLGDEKYRILILADLRACHHTTLVKAVEHFRNGGIVLATGNLPQATTLEGEHSKQTEALLRELFGDPSAHAINVNAAGGTAAYLDTAEFPGMIRSLITPDFTPAEGMGKVLHRRIGGNDVYMVTDITKGDTCFFRATGRAELWNAASGEKKELPVIRQDAGGSYIRMDKEKGESYLVVFSSGEPTIMDHAAEFRTTEEIPLTGAWEVEYVPTMNNKWGDFRLPASDEMIGPEAPVFAFRKAGAATDKWMVPASDVSGWQSGIWGYGIQMETCNIDTAQSFDKAVRTITTGRSAGWKPYEFSWKLGVWDNPGSQGFHGLKGRVDDRFLILNAGAHQFFKTCVVAASEGGYKFVTAGRTPDLMTLDGKTISPNSTLPLTKGKHELLVGYANTPCVQYAKSPFDFDTRERSMVAVFPADASVPRGTTMYDSDVSAAWGRGKHLLYTPYPGDANTWQLRAEMVPGVREIRMEVYGTIRNVWIAGEAIAAERIVMQASEEGVNRYTVTLPSVAKQIETLALEIDAAPGYQGMGVFAEPVKFTCATGELAQGSWADAGSLRYYSGGMIYHKSIELNAKAGERTELILGNVVATCEVTVNGTSAAVLMAPPFAADITDFVREGRNEIEVLVYSTLSNHYQTIPSFYRGVPDGGLIGPVNLAVSRL